MTQLRKTLNVQSYWLSLILGFLMGLGQMPFDFPFATFLMLVFIGWQWLENRLSRKEAFLRGLFLGLGYFTLTFFWIVEPFLVNPTVTAWMAPIALSILVLVLSLSWAIAFFLAAWLGKYSETRYRLLALWASLSLSEFIRSEWFIDFPWGLFASVWINTPISQTLSIFGPYWLGSLTILCAFLISISWGAATAALIMLISAYTIGTVKLEANLPMSGDQAKVRIVQPNVKQSEKWRSEFAGVFFERHLEISSEADLKSIDLIIWPETAVSYFLENDKRVGERISYDLGVPVLLGGRRFENKKLYNSVFLVETTGTSNNIYDKIKLVPFGEYIPFGGILSRVGFWESETDGLLGFSSGRSQQVLQSSNLPPFLMLICYEAIFSEFVDRGSDGATWIVQITNDAWFGKFNGPQQHFVLARMRAIEQGLPLVRVANTGISAMVDPLGRSKSRILLGEQGYRDVGVPDPIKPTIYSTIGARTWNSALLTLLLLTISSFPIITKRNKSEQK